MSVNSLKPGKVVDMTLQQSRELYLVMKLICRNEWPSARLWYIWCISNGDTTVLH